MRRDIAPSIIAIVVLTLLFGIVYPLATTGVAQVLFPNKADGSRIERDGEVVGSRLIGQDFSGDRAYFQSRPSATEYSANVTFFNNLGPNSQELSDLFAENRAAYMRREQMRPGEQVPPDAVQTSASGVDPHISEANAEIQARRVAEERGLELGRVLELVDENTDGRFLGVLGEPGVNVLELNLALDDEDAP
jgi:potassium-transporting ATPase KdpC subunit